VTRKPGRRGGRNSDHPAKGDHRDAGDRISSPGLDVIDVSLLAPPPGP
jgi:hypothetical protein